jgi:hypothetical protein
MFGFLEYQQNINCNNLKNKRSPLQSVVDHGSKFSGICNWLRYMKHTFLSATPNKHEINFVGFFLKKKKKKKKLFFLFIA